MKTILFTCKTVNGENNETLSVFEDNWGVYSKEKDFLPIICPNNIDCVRKILDTLSIDCIILTGGGEICAISGRKDIRETVEDFLIQYAIDFDIPIAGICRGLQKLLTYFDKIKPIKVSEHVKPEIEISSISGEKFIVNSFHDYGFYSSSLLRNSSFEVLHTSKDGIVKSIKHRKYNIIGVMWHPERGETDLEIVFREKGEGVSEGFDIGCRKRQQNERKD